MSNNGVLSEIASSRAGYVLAAFKEAAIPVYVLTARIFALEHKELNPIEEGCLRAMDAGLESTNDIGSFLGLQGIVLTTVLASLSSQELVNYSRAAGTANATVVITRKGRQALADSSLVVPQERIVKLAFDPLLKRVVFHQLNSLWKPRDVKSAGRLEVPLCGARRPEVEDIPLEDIERAMSGYRNKSAQSTELLSVRRIERREMNFVPCTLLFFKSNLGTEVQVAFHLDDGISVEHENAFRTLGGPDQVGANSVLKSEEDPGVLLVNSTRATKVEATSASHKAQLAESLRDAPSPTLRSIRCHEHPDLLKDALAMSSERLLIVSPWIRDQVVDKLFLMALEALLRNRVNVYIGYGLVEDGANPRDKTRGKPAISLRAQTDLEDLRGRYKNFSFCFVGNTHRKVLVSDSRFAVTTSFNWLSFKGDPNEKPRDESGTLITKAKYVEEIFLDARDLILKGYDHPREGTGAKDLT